MRRSIASHTNPILFFFVLFNFPAMDREARATDWPTYQNDNQHSGFTTATTDPTKISLQWSAPQGYAIPLLVGNSIYSMYNQQGNTTDSTKISSFDSVTGAINWTYTGNFVFPGNPTYSAGQLIFAGSTISTNSTMHVLNASTGVEQYSFTLQLAAVNNATMPTIYTNPSTGARTALFAYNGGMEAVNVGTSSASLAWTGGGSFQEGVPTIIGTSAIVVGPGQYYAFDIATGARNAFHVGDVSGGGNSTVVADAVHNRFFVQEAFSTAIPHALTAYSYTNNSTITLLWQSSTVGTGQPALDGNGNLYTVNNTTLFELNPATGAIIHSLSGRNFPSGAAPIISNNTLWIYESGGTTAFDLATFTQLAHFASGRGASNTTFQGPGLVSDNILVVDYGNVYGKPGFDVYSTTPVPEPASVLAIAAFGFAALKLRRRFRGSHKIAA
jgi:hypothetical protein